MNNTIPTPIYTKSLRRETEDIVKILSNHLSIKYDDLTIVRLFAENNKDCNSLDKLMNKILVEKDIVFAEDRLHAMMLDYMHSTGIIIGNYVLDESDKNKNITLIKSKDIKSCEADDIIKNVTLRPRNSSHNYILLLGDNTPVIIREGTEQSNVETSAPYALVELSRDGLEYGLGPVINISSPGHSERRSYPFRKDDILKNIISDYIGLFPEENNVSYFLQMANTSTRDDGRRIDAIVTETPLIYFINAKTKSYKSTDPSSMNATFYRKNQKNK